MRYLALLLAITLAYAEDKPVPQPLEVQRAMSEYERGVYQARKAYDTAISKLSGDVITNLERAKKDYMSKADLEGATLVQAAIKKINDGDALTSTEEKIKAASVNNLFKPTLEQAIVGKWKRTSDGYAFTFNADKTCETIDGKGKWLVEGKQLIITWDRFGREIAVYDEKDSMIKCAKPVWTASRIKP